jgi:uncharacterized protein YceK
MRKFLVLLLVVILSGCGAADVPDTGVTPSPSPDTTAPVDETPTAPVDETPETGQGAGAGDVAAIQQQVISQLAATIDQPITALRVESAERTEWSDGSLGCPDPAAMYTQAIEPGYNIIVNDGTRTYDIRASDRGTIIWCDGGTPRPIG